jgi:hypothetical protein
MSQRLVVAYRDLGFGGVRPYLVLHVAGVDGRSGLIPGLIDSGADRTVLPAGYASLMGYSAQDLTSVRGTQVGGSVTLWNANKPSKAFVPEIPQVVFDITPSFVHGCQTALWGRLDLMRQFDITIMERKKQFALIWDD